MVDHGGAMHCCDQNCDADDFSIALGHSLNHAVHMGSSNFGDENER